mgnify:CR=1 FL=1
MPSKRHGAVYLMAVSGAAYLVAKVIRGSRLVAFEDLGMETIREFIDHLAALIPPPRLHRHRYHGIHPMRPYARPPPPTGAMQTSLSRRVAVGFPIPYTIPKHWTGPDEATAPTWKLACSDVL